MQPVARYEPTRDHIKTSPMLLLPQGLTGASSRNTRDRMKDSRLKGSDLYVARLCKKDASINQPPNQAGSCDTLRSASVLDGKYGPKSTTSDAEPTVPSKTGSLYDELRSCSAKPKHHNHPRNQPHQTRPMATQSRPCYRCISYMHFAGIKRVFWTNAKGEWEGAKVQGLVDALVCHLTVVMLSLSDAMPCPLTFEYVS